MAYNFLLTNRTDLGTELVVRFSVATQGGTNASLQFEGNPAVFPALPGVIDPVPNPTDSAKFDISTQIGNLKDGATRFSATFTDSNFIDVTVQGLLVLLPDTGSLSNTLVQKAPAYIVYPPQSVTDAKGYAIVTGPNVDRAFKQNAHAIISQPTRVNAVGSYALFTNADSVTASKPYAVLSTFYPPYEDLVQTAAFVDQQFPTCVSFGSSGGPGFKTTVFPVDSGLTASQIEWERIRARYNVVFDHVPPADIATVEDFFYGMKGMAVGFRYKDWSDYTISNQNFAVGDGTSTVFQMFKRYNSGGITYDRIIKKPVAGTTQITVNNALLVENTDYTVSSTSGLVVFRTAPASQAICTIVQSQFDVPVRFDQDRLQVTYSDFQQLSISELPLIEVLT